MISSAQEYVDFLCKHNLSGDQFLFCCLIYERRYSLIYKLFNERNGIFQGEIDDLIARGYLIDNNTGIESHPDMYQVTEKFTKDLYGDEMEMWEELINTYPMFIFIDQKRIPAQSCDLDELRKVYFSKVKSVRRHKEIITLLKKAIDMDMVSMGIEKWIKSSQWRAVEQESTDSFESKYGEREF